MILGESTFLGDDAGLLLYSYRGQWLNNGSLVDGNLYSGFPTQLKNGSWLWAWAITNANWDGGGEATYYRYIFGQNSEMVPNFTAPCTNTPYGSIVPGADGRFILLWGEGSSFYHQRFSIMNFDGYTFSIITQGLGYDGSKAVVGQIYYGDPSNDGNLIFGEIGQNGPDPGMTAINPNTGGITERWGINYPASIYANTPERQKWIASRWGNWFLEYNQDMKGGQLAEYEYGVQSTNVTAGSSAWNVYAGSTNRDSNNQYKPCFFIKQRGVMNTATQMILSWGSTTFARITHCIPSLANSNHFYFAATGDLGVNYEQSYHALLVGCIDVSTKQFVWVRQITSAGSNPQFVVQGLKISQGQFCIAFRDYISTGNRYYSRFLYGPLDATFPIGSIPSKINISNVSVTVVTNTQSPRNVYNVTTIGAGFQNAETFNGPIVGTADTAKLSYLGQDQI